ncbi:MFS transporter [Chitinophaga sedimenti]|nr:MFS transporter [Chitinophaga sedimenti]MCK7554009.1 MFS transporter [Chitinophaga sedimenti]
MISNPPAMRMSTSEFIAFSACSMMLTAVGIDIMLPVFGELRRHFGLGPHSADTSKVVTFFFWGQVAQLLFGTLSDRYGRLAILRIGFPLYIAGGIVAAFAPSLSILFAARFVAGMGASAVFMTTIAGVRDRFSGDAMARTLSFILTIFLFTPVVAPFLGLVILSVASWQAVFLTPPLSPWWLHSGLSAWKNHYHRSAAVLFIPGQCCALSGMHSATPPFFVIPPSPPFCLQASVLM